LFDSGVGLIHFEEMAQVQLKWDSLPEGFRDFKAFLPAIAGVMRARFPTSQGYRHLLIGNTDYRVRRGVFGGWNVRLWRQENLIIDVGAGSRFDSALPVLSLLLTLPALAGIEVMASAFEWTLFPSSLTKKGGLILLAVGTIGFLIVWTGLWLLARPLVWAMRRDRLDQELLDEIRKVLPGEPADPRSP
jgi:hypothetical protein